MAMGLSTSGEAAHAYLDWLTVVARDEIEARVAACREGRPDARRPADFNRGGGQDLAGVGSDGWAVAKQALISSRSRIGRANRLSNFDRGR